MKYEHMFQICAGLIRGKPFHGKRNAVAYKSIWRQSSRGIQRTDMVDTYEAAKKFMELERSPVQWLR